MTLKNFSTTTRVIGGWTLRDLNGHVYKSPATSIAAGQTLVVHTGKGTNVTSHRYWGLGYYVWNNSGTDTAILRNTVGTTVSYCGYVGNSTPGVKSVRDHRSPDDLGTEPAPRLVVHRQNAPPNGGPSFEGNPEEEKPFL